MRVPDGWKEIQLQQVAEVRSGLSKSAKREGPMIRRPYLRVANVQNGYLDLADVKEINVPADQVERFTLKAGDVLLIEGNGNPQNLGRGCLWKGQIENCVHQNHVFAVRVTDQTTLNPEFLIAQLQSERGQNYLLLCAKGSTGLSTLNAKQIRQLPLLLPPAYEQNLIARLMTNWNYAIDLTEHLITAKEERRKWFMRELLTGKRRLPGFKNPWKEAHIGDVFKPVKRRNDKGCTVVLTASGEHGLVDQKDFFKRSVASESLEDYYLLKKGEFAYNRSAMNGYPYGAIKRLDAYDEGVLSILYLCFAHNDNSLDPKFFEHYFESGALNKQLRMIVQVGARAHGLLNVTLHDFFSLKIPIPPKLEQERITEYIDGVNRELDLLRQKLNAFREQKKGLMQQLLTGKVRVKVTEGNKSSPRGKSK